MPGPGYGPRVQRHVPGGLQHLQAAPGVALGRGHPDRGRHDRSRLGAVNSVRGSVDGSGGHAVPPAKADAEADEDGERDDGPDDPDPESRVGPQSRVDQRTADQRVDGCGRAGRSRASGRRARRGGRCGRRRPGRTGPAGGPGVRPRCARRGSGGRLEAAAVAEPPGRCRWPGSSVPGSVLDAAASESVGTRNSVSVAVPSSSDPGPAAEERAQALLLAGLLRDWPGGSCTSASTSRE